MAKQATMTVSVATTKVSAKVRRGFFKTRSETSSKKETFPMEIIPENLKFLDIEYI